MAKRNQRKHKHIRDSKRAHYLRTQPMVFSLATIKKDILELVKDIDGLLGVEVEIFDKTYLDIALNIRQDELKNQTAITVIERFRLDNRDSQYILNGGVDDFVIQALTKLYSRDGSLVTYKVIGKRIYVNEVTNEE